MGTSEYHHVVIVGAGLGGIGAAVRLRRKGVTDLVIIDAAGSPGGTWRDNSYPGCQCDIPSNLYSLSFAPNPGWSTTYPRQPEIRDYIEDVVVRQDLSPLIRYHTELLGARWDDAAASWRLTTTSGQLSAAVLVLAVGFLSEPTWPPVGDLSRFRGASFHSARWDHDVDLTGKRVAVVGTGASAVQLIPEITPRAGHLDVYQRTPAWVLPHPDRPVTAAEKWLYRQFPASQVARRAVTFVASELRHAALTGTGPMNRAARAVAVFNIRRAIKDPDLAARLTPRYELGCKRVLLSNRYYPALAKPHVTVVSDSVAAVTPTGLLSASGQERPADVIIFATGFRITHREAYRRIHGRAGQNLADAFDAHGAYVGVTAAGFPNLFCVGGPTSGVGHTSFLYMLESQQIYIAAAVAAIRDRDLTSVEVRRDSWAGYFGQIQADTVGKVWASGCSSWFLDANGRNVAVWPGYSWSFHRRIRRFDDGAYLLTARAPVTGGPAHRLENHV
jgi:cation diffusion facilitator CzcD-associated flavoprotein CzcO